MFYFNQTCIPTIPQEKLGTKPPTTITGCCSVAQLWPTLCAPMDCSTPGFPVLHHFLELVQTRPIESVMPSNHLILCCPFLLLPLVFPSIGVFSSESALHIRQLKYWSFSISPSNEYSGLVSFRIDWFDLLAIQGKAVTPPQQANRLQRTDLCLLHVDQTLLLKLIYKQGCSNPLALSEIPWSSPARKQETQFRACGFSAACHLSLFLRLLFSVLSVTIWKIISMLIQLAIILTVTFANLPLQFQELRLTSLKVTLNCSLVRIPELYPSLLLLMRL